jgi:beta-lactamase class A
MDFDFSSKPLWYDKKMRNRNQFSALRWFSLAFILFGVILFTLQLVRFSRVWANLPNGLTIGNVPVGQLDRQGAAERLREAYSIPIELHYGSSVMQLSPSVVGFEMDLESMLAAADIERTRQPFWIAFWNFLWGQATTHTDIPLRTTYSEVRLRQFLTEEVAARYDHPSTSAMPVAGSVSFQPGQPGTSLDVDGAVILIDAALHSTTQRVVNLPIKQTNPTRPAFKNLEILLKQTIDLSGFDGLASVYLKDLQNTQEIHFLYQQGKTLPSQPDVAFTASSTIKIPIMVSVFKRLEDAPSTDVSSLLTEMIVKSGNPAADKLMQTTINQIRGPLEVTADMKALGLQNTFMAGYFYQGAPLLQKISTPANSRTDIQTDPDPYSQTTPTDIGMLLEDIYQCAQVGGGSLVAVFPGQINQAKCQAMLDYLKSDHIAVLIQAGVPDGTKVAHKHGWVVDNLGVMHNISDAAIVYTPGGNYVLAVYLYHPTQMVWDPASKLVSDLSKAVYNYYNFSK